MGEKKKKKRQNKTTPQEIPKMFIQEQSSLLQSLACKGISVIVRGQSEF